MQIMEVTDEAEDVENVSRPPLRNVKNSGTPIKNLKLARFYPKRMQVPVKRPSQVLRKKFEDRFLRQPAPKNLPKSVMSLEKNSSKSMVNMSSKEGACSPENIQVRL